MRFLLPLTLVGSLVLSACAHKSATAPTDVESAPAVKDLQSFHLNDPQAPEVVDQEIENIPTEVNPMVDKWLDYFQGRGRRHMERYLARSTRYEKLMKKVLRENGLPEDLFYIAMIESGFSSSAVSHAAAVGYWQFIRGTGKRYGLEISKLVDERRDPVLATQAAAEYFKGLYSVFGSWYLAMASYNVGENRVLREVRKHQTRDFWELVRKSRLPKETLNYIPKYIAAKMIAKDPATYGFSEIDYLDPIEFDTVTLEKSVNLRVMAEKMNFNYEDFKALNPKFKGEVASLKKSTLDLRIPVGQKELAIQAASESVAESVEFIADVDTQAYKIRRGDNLGAIARRFRTTVAYLRDLNDLPRKKNLRVGSTIYVPDRTPLQARSDRTAKTRVVSPKAVAAADQNDGGGKFHVVRSGDNLSTIARRYGTTVSELSRLNNLSRGKMLKIGMKLLLPGEGGGSSDSGIKPRSEDKNAGGGMGRNRQRRPVIHVVKRGESLTRIAAKYKVSVPALTRKNSIRNPAALTAGARLVIPPLHARD